MSDVETKKRRPVKRWIVLVLIAAGIYAAFIGPTILKPIAPVVVLPGEPTGLAIGDFQITNTIMATLLTDLVLVIIAIGAWRFARSGKVIPQGFYNGFEAIVEFLWNTTSNSVEKKWARRIFPLVATIFLLIFAANMIKLFPGFESIGQLHESPHGEGYAAVKLFEVGDLGVYTLDAGQPVTLEHHGEYDDHAAATDYEEDHYALCEACEVVPFLRGSATDLNFTLALAVLTVVMVQVYGVWALGPGYFSKYFPIQEVRTKGAIGAVSLFVGILEIVLEFAKILSFAFRLFGNIFAGALLLSIVGSLLPVIIPPGLYIFEIFFGIIQAYVFFLLAVVFISGALVSHHGDHAEEHH
ncbi:MAG: F0F1 ATP synthase subunit A [Anaerolineales bacterium]|nr:F0F1 ATP synthase subunit A [Anaerolineales bacterium]